MYLDASAILALLLEDPEAEALARRIDEARAVLKTSPVTIAECVLRFAARKGVAVALAHAVVTEALAALKVQTVTVTPEIGSGAMRAYTKYGKAKGHPAQLDLPGAFAYACAKNHGIPLLYVGGGFAHTDLA